MGDVRIPVSSAELPADNNEKQEHSYRGCSSGGFCTARAVLAYIFGITFAEARTLHGAAALGHAAAEPRRLLGGSCREPTKYGIRKSPRIVIEAAIISIRPGTMSAACPTFRFAGVGHAAGAPVHSPGWTGPIRQILQRHPL